MPEMITRYISLRNNTKDKEKKNGLVTLKRAGQSGQSIGKVCVCVCVIFSAITSIHARGC